VDDAQRLVESEPEVLKVLLNSGIRITHLCFHWQERDLKFIHIGVKNAVRCSVSLFRSIPYCTEFQIDRNHPADWSNSDRSNAMKTLASYKKLPGAIYFDMLFGSIERRIDRKFHSDFFLTCTSNWSNGGL